MRLGLFSGSDFNPARDQDRLANQYQDIFNLMSDGKWRTLSEIAHLTGHPEASVSAQLRHARKPKFGSHAVNKRYVLNGLYEYQLLINYDEQPELEFA